MAGLHNAFAGAVGLFAVVAIADGPALAQSGGMPGQDTALTYPAEGKSLSPDALEPTATPDGGENADCTPAPEVHVLPGTGFAFALPPDPDETVECPPPEPPPPPRPPALDIFGQAAIPSGEHRGYAQWIAARSQTLTDRPGPWDSLLRSARHLDGAEQIALVNRWVNWHVRFRDESEDRWTSAPITLTRGYGDCEDFAIAKMALLEQLGVSLDDMFLVVVRDKARRIDHAVLAVREQGGGIWVLDNRLDRIQPAPEVRDYEPLLSYSGTFAWVYGHRS